jgi:DNA-directed RNA polymerase subunit K/omega
MSDIKTRVQNLDPNVTARDIKELVRHTGNIYESLNIITRRAKQLSMDIKFYEKLPNPVIIATDEYIRGEIHYRYVEEKKQKKLPS